MDSIPTKESTMVNKEKRLQISKNAVTTFPHVPTLRIESRHDTKNLLKNVVRQNTIQICE